MKLKKTKSSQAQSYHNNLNSLTISSTGQISVDYNELFQTKGVQDQFKAALEVSKLIRGGK
jgi:hypothetical protein